MATIDLNWPAQVKTCEVRIAELEEKIGSQRQKIQRLLEQKKDVTWDQSLLGMSEKNLERAQTRTHFIESKIADQSANQRPESNATVVHLIIVDAASQPQ
jgi:hypothetical protein